MDNAVGVALLAVLQGVAEFLPISSSGHLVIAQRLLGINEQGIRLEVMLHLGTLVSIVVYYRAALARLVVGCLRRQRESLLLAGYIALSAVPAVLIYFPFKDRIEAFYEQPKAVGGFLVFTGTILLFLRWIRRGSGSVNAPRALIVGLAQAFAILPGVSRSGMTISAARMAEVKPEEAAEFSFLMSLPLLAGGALLDIIGSIRHGAPSSAIPEWQIWFGAGLAAVVGFAALSLLVKLLKGGHFWIFGVYCIIVGILVAAFM